MAFDMNTARPEQAAQPAATGFDMSTATPEQTGATPDVNSDNLPSAVNNVELLAAPTQPIEQPKATLGGDLESMASLASGIPAEIGAGLAGIVSAPFVGIKEAVKNIDSVRELLTFSPRSDEAKQTLKDIGETLQPVGESFKKVETALGASVLDATGSPALAAIAHSLPTATLELIGVRGLKGSKLKNTKLSSNVPEAIQQSAPDIKTIKQAATKAYSDLDNLGIKVKPEVYENFTSKLASKLKAEGIDPTLHPKSTATINRFLDDVGQAKTPSELNTLRKIAKDAAGSIDPSDARLGTIIVREVDNAIDSLSSQVGGKFKEARTLSQRAFKSQAITDMIENASHTASGMENGLRIEARKILKNKKKRRGFTSDELAALRKIEQGTTTANTAKFLGKFGVSEGQATSMLGASIGIGGGGAIGSFFGPGGAAIGALGVPALGQIAKKTAQRLTLKSANFADDLVRSGKNAKEIAKAYIKHTPKSKRNVTDLTDLLLDANLSPSAIKGLPSSKSTAGRMIDDSIHFANEIKRKAKQAGSVATISAPGIIKQEN